MIKMLHPDWLKNHGSQTLLLKFIVNIEKVKVPADQVNLHLLIVQI